MSELTMKNFKANTTTTPEEYDYQPMIVPEHIYLYQQKESEPKSGYKENRPQMVVPSRITVGGGETSVASKAQPMEVIRDRQVLLPASEGINGIPDTLTANELPQEDFIQTAEAPSPEHPHYSSQTSIFVDKDPLHELKIMRRRLNQLIKRVQNLELESQSYKDERPYLIAAGFLLTGTLVVSLLHSLLSRK